MANETKQGIWCKMDNKFYYLDTGPMRVVSVIDKLLNILVKRELITFHRRNRSDLGATYKVITMDDARDRGLEIETLYMNRHLAAQAQKEQEEEIVDPWRS